MNLPRICERGLGAAKTDCPPYRGLLRGRPVTVVVQLKDPFRLQGIEHASFEYLAGVSLVYERTIVTSTLNDRLEDLTAHVILCHQFVSVWSTPTSTGVDGGALKRHWGPLGPPLVGTSYAAAVTSCGH